MLSIGILWLRYNTINRWFYPTPATIRISILVVELGNYALQNHGHVSSFQIAAVVDIVYERQKSVVNVK